jgi:hypothetical protein
MKRAQSKSAGLKQKAKNYQPPPPPPPYPPPPLPPPPSKLGGKQQNVRGYNRRIKCTLVQEHRQRTSTTATATTVIPALPGNAISIARHIGCAPLLLGVIELLVERDSLAFVEGLEAFGVDGREVHEDIVATVLWGDKAEALIAEEFDSAVLSHLVGNTGL